MPGLIPDDSDKDDDIKPWPAFINDIDDQSIANVFYFGAFADKNTGVVYNELHRQLPLYVAQWQRMFFRDVPLQNKRNLCNAHPWS